MQNKEKSEVEGSDLKSTIIEHLTETDAEDLSKFLDTIYAQALDSRWNGVMDPGDRVRQYETIMQLKTFFHELQYHATCEIPELQAPTLAN